MTSLAGINLRIRPKKFLENERKKKKYLLTLLIIDFLRTVGYVTMFRSANIKTHNYKFLREIRLFDQFIRGNIIS